MKNRRVYWLRYWTGDSTCRLRDGSSSLLYCTKYPECSTLWRDTEGTGIVRKLREAGGMHRPELDGNSRNILETTVSYKVRARLTPTLTHVVTYKLVTSGAEDDAMSQPQEWRRGLWSKATRARRRNGWGCSADHLSWTTKLNVLGPWSLLTWPSSKSN